METLFNRLRRYWRVSIILVSMTCLIFGGCRQERAVESLTVEEAMALVAQLEQAANSGTKEEMLSLMHDDVIIRNGGEVITKKEYGSQLVGPGPSTIYSHNVQTATVDVVCGSVVVQLECYLTHVDRWTGYDKTLVITKRYGRVGVAERTTRPKI